ncbi:sorting nexin-30-like [Sinocyclocheilus rhinocerous]|uniref:sorting nexin-30-like n=1 Tax=Sinocyclocheilus rhinocerous TaxID=307959 RepID=UPI0007B9B9E5|nr:PREDICTED: sorting nexin-30-like [Sinocyclocheilus rhinocerous]
MSAGTPRSLASSGQKSIQDICHPLSAEESALSRIPDVLNPGSAGERDLILPNGTPVDTSSPASSSSLLNRLQLDDDLDGETRDEQKYNITTEFDLPEYSVRRRYQDFDWLRNKLEESQPTHLIPTTRTEFDLPEYSVRRRYQDFDWLRNKLEESQPTHLIPPLPEKFVMKGVVDRFSEEFVETRRKALDKFLKRVADHPVLSFNEHFNAFLSAKDLNKRQGLALLTKMGESVKYVTGGYKVRARPVEFAAMGDYLDLFTQKLGTIDRIAQRIIKEQSEFLMELREYGPVYSSWSSFEEDLHDPLEGVSGCVSNCSSALEELTEDMSEDFLPVLREYVLYIESMKNVLKKRDQVQAEYETKLEAVVFREDKKTPVPSDVEKCQDRVECFNADLKADWDRWENNKRQDFRQLLTGMSNKNILYYEKCLAAWESLIPLLQDKQEAKGETN